MVSVSPEEEKGTNLTKRREEDRWENRREIKGEGLGVLCLKDTQKGFWDFEDMEQVRGVKGAWIMVGVLSTVAIAE